MTYALRTLTACSLLLLGHGVQAQSPDFPPHILTLAASCAACHGTNGNSVDGRSLDGNAALAGLDAGYFITQMQAFRSGERSSTVMHRHAKGLTEQEIAQLAQYFAAQKPMPGLSPPAQRLQGMP